MFRIFEPCRTGDCSDCAGVIAQSSERRSAEDGVVEATCTHACHQAEGLTDHGGEG